MKSKTSFFNGTIFLKNIKRFWVIWGTYLAIMLLSLPTAIRAFSYSNTNANRTANNFMVTGMGVGIFMSFAFALLTAIALFNYLFKAKSASMLHALPVRRETLFFTNYLSGICFLIIPNLITIGVTAIVSSGAIPFITYLEWFAAMAVMNVFFFSFAVFCAMLTGHVVAMPLLYAVLNFCIIVIEFVAKAGACLFIYGLSVTDVKSWRFVPLVNLYRQMHYENGRIESGWGYLIALAVIAVIFTLVSMYMYKKRQLESAQDVIAPRVLKPVFKYAMAVGCSLILGAILFACIFFNVKTLTGAKIAVVFCAMLGGFIGYFGAEMMLKKTFRVFKSSYKGFLVAFAAMLLIVAGMQFDVFGIENNVPDTFKNVTMSFDGDYKYTFSSDNEQAKQIEVIQKQVIAQKNKFGKFDYIGSAARKECTYYIEFEYELTDGSTLKRQYAITYNPDQLEKGDLPNIIDDFVNKQENIQYRYRRFIGNSEQKIQEITFYKLGSNNEQLTIQKKDYNGLYAAINADLAKGAVQKIDFVGGDIYHLNYDKEGKDTWELNIRYSVSNDGRSNWDSLYINEDYVNTMAYLRDTGYLK